MSSLPGGRGVGPAPAVVPELGGEMQRGKQQESGQLCPAETDSEQPAITLKDETLEAVETFSYLRSEVGRTARVDGDVSARLKKAATAYQMRRRKVFRSRSVSRSTKVRVFRVMVMSVLLYGAETWAVTQQDLRRLHAFQMKCLRGIVGVTLWYKRRNVDILAETGEMPVKDLLKVR